MIQLTQQRGGLFGGGVSHQLDIKIIIKGDVGQRAALDGLHIVAAGTDDLNDLGQLAGLLSSVNSRENRLPAVGFSRLRTMKRVVLSPSVLMLGTSTSSP